MDRIFTATAIIFRSDAVLLVEHLKSGYLLPQGGALNQEKTRCKPSGGRSWKKLGWTST